MRSILQIAATVAATIACGGNVACGMVAAALISGAVTGLSGGKLSDMLRATAMAVISAVAFHVVGGVSTAIGGTAGFAVKVAGHAGVGCLTAVASGGSCGSGAASAAVSAAATPLVGEVFPNPRGNVSDLIGGTATHAAIGGFASVAGGGKFENGAVTAAFGYLFNALLHKPGEQQCFVEGDCKTQAGAVGAGRNVVPLGEGFGDTFIGRTISWLRGLVSGPSTRFIGTKNGIVDLGPTIDRIQSGGMYPHRNDGATYMNRGEHLPAQPHGYYNEYVVPTPGVAGPGAMRMVIGQQGEAYFTPDHYRNFIRVR